MSSCGNQGQPWLYDVTESDGLPFFRMALLVITRGDKVAVRPEFASCLSATLMVIMSFSFPVL